MSSSKNIKVRFLGVGDASQNALGHAAIVIEQIVSQSLSGSNTIQRLLVDCGPGVLNTFLETYQCLPDAVFITHCHLDHIADFEKLFIKSWFSGSDKSNPDSLVKPRHIPKVFVPADIIPLLHQRVGSYPSALAEGGVNFWEAFQLIPVSDSFEFYDLMYKVFPVRHHGEGSAYSLYLPDTFFYSGDTRPIPDLLTYKVSDATCIFHDCSVVGNPSHTGIEDIFREYPPELIERLYIYHYNNSEQESEFLSRGLRVVKSGQVFEF